MESFKEKTEIEGIWWLLDKPDDRLTGKMFYYDGDFIKLELIGSFDSIDKGFPDRSRYIIHGFSKDGKKITMFDCHIEHHQNHFPGLPIYLFSSSYIFIGGHFRKEEELFFKSASFLIENLYEWVSISGFKINLTRLENKIDFEFQLPEPQLLFRNEEFDIWLDFYTKEYNINFVCQKDFKLEQYVELRIEFKKDTHINDILKILNSIVRFFSLIITKPVDVINVYLINYQNKYTYERDERHKEKFVYINSHVKLFKKEKNIDSRYMLFTFSHLKDKLQDILEKWFNNCNVLEPVFNLYFATIFNTNLYANDEFLNLIHAVESYHRRNYVANEMTKEECEKRINALINFKPEYQDWLNIRLKYAYELTLRKRLKFLFSEYESLFENYINDIKKFSDRLTDTRNYYTHFDESLKSSSFEGIELYYASTKIKILLIACFLKELGFSKEETIKMIKENNNYNYELTNHKF